LFRALHANSFGTFVLISSNFGPLLTHLLTSLITTFTCLISFPHLFLVYHVLTSPIISTQLSTPLSNYLFFPLLFHLVSRFNSSLLIISLSIPSS